MRLMRSILLIEVQARVALLSGVGISLDNLELVKV